MTRPLYILLRNDLLGMTPGRAAAQASHATSLLHECFYGIRISNSPAYSKMKSAFIDWTQEGGGTFGTTIVKSASFDEIRHLLGLAGEVSRSIPSRFDFFYDPVVDPEYLLKGPGELFRSEDVLTGAVFFFPEEIEGPTLNLWEKISGVPLY